MVPRVAISIVTYNSGSVVDQCLASVFAQTFDDVGVLVTDNASSDNTVARLIDWRTRGARVIVNETNRYCSRAHNEAIRGTDSEFVVTLNPDVLLMPDYLSIASAEKRVVDLTAALDVRDQHVETLTQAMADRDQHVEQLSADASRARALASQTPKTCCHIGTSHGWLAALNDLVSAHTPHLHITTVRIRIRGLPFK